MRRVEQVNASGRSLQKLVGFGAISAPAMHSLTDLSEWITGGFSTPHLWANYASFVAMPFVAIGLYAVQRPRIGFLGLAGALLYGTAFVYFAHTSLYALAENVSNYATLWALLGPTYTAHGIVMILGGASLGVATYQAGFFPAWTSIAFLCGIGLNFALSAIGAPEIFQTVGSALRNAGLIGMGAFLLGSRSGDAA